MTRIPLEHARARLSIVWFLGAALIAIVLITLSIADYYQDLTGEIWGWMLPLIIPTLAIMVSVLGASALRPSAVSEQVDGFFFKLAFWLSVSYLALILVMILVEPFSDYETLELFILSNYWLAPFQGLVIIAMGALFYTKESS